ncbi:Morphogenetic protein [Klebsiella pneumoniae]
MIFNAEMVRALLDGRKTQTRRPIKWKQTRFTEIGEREDGSKWPWSEDAEHACDFWHPCPFGAVGDRIWVREAFRVHSRATDVATLVYKASERNSWTEQTRRVPVAVCNKPATPEKWTPSLHMPRWASRIMLEITGVRVERLNAISPEDAESEGLERTNFTGFGDEPGLPSYPEPDVYFDPLKKQWKEYPPEAFAGLWESIYGEGSWKANPWVWVIEFKRVEGGAA